MSIPQTSECPITVARLGDGPIITPDTHASLTEHGHGNINGPSLIVTPPWLDQSLGRYYLYFAHHQGTFIRLAIADNPTGPWRIYEPGVLPLEQTPFDGPSGHIASPDVHIDHDQQRLVMYYHGCPARRSDPDCPWVQATCVAYSSDGLNWQSESMRITEPYLRVFEWQGKRYGITAAGSLFREDQPNDPTVRWTRRRASLDRSGRHWALLRREDTLHLFYSRWGDRPEHVLYAPLCLTDDWNDWQLIDRWSLLWPERDWEGADQSLTVSLNGAVHHPVNQLRDPAIFQDPHTANDFLVYSIAGESGLAIAQLHGLAI